jgi:dehydrogenase/reductase SDR family member 12
MTRLHERLRTDLPVEAAFDFIADFANSHAWDPGTAWSRRSEPRDGPIGLGTAFELGVVMGKQVAPMTYRIMRFERPSRVVLVGSGSGVDAVDDIRFEQTGDGTTIDYTADIRLRGVRGLIQPFLGGTFERIGRDAAAGMASTLAGLAASGEQRPGDR